MVFFLACSPARIIDDGSLFLLLSVSGHRHRVVRRDRQRGVARRRVRRARVARRRSAQADFLRSRRGARRTSRCSSVQGCS